MEQFTLKEVRFNSGLTQEQFAHAIGMSKTLWGYKENYKRLLKAHELIAICDFTGLDPRQIILEL